MSYAQRYSYVPVVVPGLQNLKMAGLPKRGDDDDDSMSKKACKTAECCYSKYPSAGSQRDECVTYANKKSETKPVKRPKVFHKANGMDSLNNLSEIDEMKNIYGGNLLFII